MSRPVAPVRSRSVRLFAALLVLVSATAAEGGTQTATRTSAFEYDATTGLITAEIVEPTDAQHCVRTTYAYTDAVQTTNYGNKVAATTGNCSGASGRAVVATRTSATSFAAQTVTVNGVSISTPAGTSATSATNALGQSESRLFDPRFGVATAVTGPNALTTTWQLDDFGRKVLETRADGTSTRTDYCYLAGAVADTSTNSPNCAGSAPSDAPSAAVMYVQTVTLDTSGAVNGAFVRVYVDRLSREIRSVTQSFDGNGQSSRLIAKDTLYNAQGLVVETTQPYFLDSGSSLSSTGSTHGASASAYDVLGRPTAIYVADATGSQGGVSFPDGSVQTASRTTYAYVGLAITVTNDKGQTQTSEKNAAGQVVRTTDATGAQLVSLYGPFGNLLKTFDPLGNSIVMTYDIRGHKLSLQDPDAGLWQYDYDALGQLVWQQNANQQAAGQATTMAYDVVGRMTQRAEPEYISTWTYDQYSDGSTCAKGIGKLCDVVTTNGTRRLVTFDNVGRPQSTQLIITNGPTFTSSVGYDAANGRVVAQTYPTGLTVTLGYSALGFFQRLANAAGDATLWQAQTVNAWGGADSQVFGNGVQTRKIFDGLTGRVAEIDADPGTGTNAVMRHRYTYDSIDNLVSRIDDDGAGDGNAVSESFAYDAINRLNQYQVAAPAIPSLARNVTIGYNALGAMLEKSDVGVYAYPASGASSVRPHAVSSINGVSYSYDANGNLIAASGGKYQSIAYTTFNLPDNSNGVGGPSGTPRYMWQYDANHQRVKETHVNSSGTRTTWYVHPDNAGSLAFEYEIAADGIQTSRHYLSAGGVAIGVLVTNGAYNSGSAATVVKTEYWHRDHLGSVAVTTDSSGTVTQRYAYDPFGKRRYSNGNYDATGALVLDYPNATDRGFTAHEQLDDVGIVHMNGRLYDANTARFLQADILIQQPENLQNYARYSYLYSNPLNGSDPSGFFSWKGLFRGLTSTTINPFDPRHINNLIASQPGQAQFDHFVLGHQWALGLVNTIAGIATYYCGGCGTILTSSYYAYESSGQSFRVGFEVGLHETESWGLSYAGSSVTEYLYGNTYNFYRVGMDALIAGGSSRLAGGNFWRGFEIGGALSLLTFANYEMRQRMVAQSSLQTWNSNGESSGFFGDFFKLAGARRDVIYDFFGPILLENCVSLMGGCQGAPIFTGDQRSSFFGFSYSPGSLPDYINEGFAGPHDFLRNLTGSYDALGNAIQFTGLRSSMDSLLNYVLIGPAAILALPALAPEVLQTQIPADSHPRNSPKTGDIGTP